MRNAAINLRARTEQRELVDQAANLLGKNRSRRQTPPKPHGVFLSPGLQ